MNKETLRMQMLSGVITESEYKAKLEENKKSTKKPLKENFVGIGAINNPFADRKKETYEDAFEYFLNSKYELNEIEEGKEVEEPSLYEGEEEYNQIVDNLIDNFDDSREASAGIDKLKKMGMWDEFLKSDKGATFQKLRKSLR